MQGCESLCDGYRAYKGLATKLSIYNYKSFIFTPQVLDRIKKVVKESNVLFELRNTVGCSLIGRSTVLD